MEKARQRLTLDRPAAYQIKVPGHLDAWWPECGAELSIVNGCDRDGSAVTTLTGVVDQAALHGILRQLYAFGLPLIAVTCLEAGD